MWMWLVRPVAVNTNDKELSVVKGLEFEITKVMSWENGFKLRNTHLICLLQTAQCSVVQIASVVKITVAFCDNPTVYSCCIAMPDIDVDIVHWLAIAHVDDLNIEHQLNTLLFVSDITANQLTTDVEWTFRDFWLENAR